MKKSTIWAVLIYGIVIGVLGYIGYHHSQSKASLFSGLGSATFLVLSSLMMLFRRNSGLYLSLGATLFLTVTFCYRYSITHGMIPAILAVLSGGMLLYLLVQMGRWKK